MGWFKEAEDLANTLGMGGSASTGHVVGSLDEGVQMRLWNTGAAVFEHVHECYALLSQKRGLVPVYVVRWFGVKTNTLRAEQTKLYGSVADALRAIRARYDNEETIWRLGG
jgi:hypothetical protein